MKLFKCSVCGNVVELIHEGGGTLVCCGKPMELLVPNTVEASLEKHIPVINYSDNKLEIRVGDIIHPFTEEHYISFIVIEYDNKILKLKLDKTKEPIANIDFNYQGNINVYAYCNLHGLWTTSKNI
jgi:superoxide reductase